MTVSEIAGGHCLAFAGKAGSVARLDIHYDFGECRHHHRLVHEGGCSVEMGPDRQVRFTAPDGKPIPQVPEARFRGNVPALVAENHRAGLVIGPGTTIPDWYGAPMNDQMAVEGMLELE